VGVPLEPHAAHLLLQGGGAYTIGLGGVDAVNDSLLVRAGDVTLDLGGAEYEVVNDSPEGGISIADLTGDVAALTVTGGGEMRTFDLQVARQPGTEGSLSVDGLGTDLFVENEMFVGVRGEATFTLANGAGAHTLLATIGDRSGSHGEALITGAGSVWEIPILLLVNNGNITLADGGALSVAGGGTIVFREGTISGWGAIMSDVVNFGAMAPDGDFTLNVLGDYEQRGAVAGFGEEAGVLRLTVPTTAADFEAFVVGGDAELGGSLVVEFEDVASGASAKELDGLTLLTAGSITGSFDAALLPSLAAEGLFLSLDVVNDGLRAGSISLTALPLVEDIVLDPALNFGLDGVPTGAALGDLDGDGDLDLAVVVPNMADPENAPGSVVVFLNGGTTGSAWDGFDTQLAPISVGAQPVSVAIADFDGMNGNDLVVANAGEESVTVRLNDGMGTPGFPGNVTANVSGAPTDVIATDFDG
ncbi:MAG: hypothetical protein VYC34_09330, partial [Planctomycetota bacterium]|nr:hypothetical protein [Planctomycetota bacterium]